jgi:DNA-binding transcriptional MocR family regulator
MTTQAMRSISSRSLASLLGEWRSGSPAYGALARAIVVALLDGRLPPQCRLPAERDLAAALDVSRTTVTAAYDALRTSGHLVSRRGSGSWAALPAGARSRALGWAAADVANGGGHVHDLASAAPGGPAEILVAAAREAVEELPRHVHEHGYDPVGLPALRAAVAERYRRRGVPTTPEQILIINGALQGLDLALRLLVRPGDRVVTDSPSYPTALDTMRASGARLVPVGLSWDGWNVDLLTASYRQSAPRLGYLIADFHNPTGLVMPDEARAASASAAARAGAYLVVDESFVDLAYDGAAYDGAAYDSTAYDSTAPMAAHDPDGHVLSVGSLSKPFWGGLRVGWVRADPELVTRLAAVRAVADMASPMLEQLIAIRLLEVADEVLPARRLMFSARRDALAAALRRELPEWRFAVPGGGLAIWVELDAAVSTALAVAAGRRGVWLAPGPRFGVDGTLERFLRLPFVRPAEDLDDAVARIAAARAQLDPGASRPPLVVA